MDIVNSFEIEGEKFYFYDISKVIKDNEKLQRLPIVLKILLEANLRKAKDNTEFSKIIDIFENRKNQKIGFYPSRMIMQGFSYLNFFMDLASMRDFAKKEALEANKINPEILVDMIIDDSLDINNKNIVKKENEKNKESYGFAKWAENSFSNLRIIPPGSGICHQINLEYLSTILHIEKKEDKFFLYPETIVGTDTNTAMINSFGVLGWSVDSIKAQGVMLGNELFLPLPKVIGVKVCKQLKETVTSWDIVSGLVKLLKEQNVKNCLIEFYGEGLKYLTLENRAVISKSAFEYEAKCSFFAVDDKTIKYFDETRENEDYGKLIETYLKKQNLFYQNENLDYDRVIEFDLSKLCANVLFLKKPQESIDIESLQNFPKFNKTESLEDSDIVTASIVLSTFLKSNSYILAHAALIAKKAVALGLKVNSKTKASLVIEPFIKEYLEKLDFLKYFKELGFIIIDYKKDNSIFNIESSIEKEIKSNNLNLCSVISSDIQIEDMLNPLIKSNYKMSASLVILYSLTGKIDIDLFNKEICADTYLADLWPKSYEVTSHLGKLDKILYKDIYKNIFRGDEFWQKLKFENSSFYNWDKESTYIQSLTFKKEPVLEKLEIQKAGILAIFGDNISTKQIFPLGQISLYSPAARYLESMKVKSFEYGTFEDRKQNAEVMTRGVFDSIDIKNLMISKEGGYTKDYENNEIVSIYDKALAFKKQNRDSLIFAGENFAKGVSSYWAARSIGVLGIKAVIAKSFDEVYKEDLISFGVLPLEFVEDDIKTLKLKGDESITISDNLIKVNSIVKAEIHKNGIKIEIDLKTRLDTKKELELYKNRGILNSFFEKKGL